MNFDFIIAITFLLIATTLVFAMIIITLVFAIV